MGQSQLPYVVECKSLYAFFEPIAAFNHDKIAINYAVDCHIANPQYQYRVVKRKLVLYSSDAE
jgi:hypothetical protein